MNSLGTFVWIHFPFPISRSVFFVFLNILVFAALLVVCIVPLDVILLSQISGILQNLWMQLYLKAEQPRHYSQGTRCLYYPLTL